MLEQVADGDPNVELLLGTAAGGGFLKSATDALSGLENPTSGLIKTAETNIFGQITSLNSQIANKQVNTLQQNLTAQMAAADAALSTMEQQYNYLSGLFQAQQVANQQYANL